MTTIFIVWHVHNADGEMNNAKLIGIYSSKQNAMDAVARCRQKPGFREHPDEFSIDEYPVDEDHWTEGFITEG